MERSRSEYWAKKTPRGNWRRDWKNIQTKRKGRNRKTCHYQRIWIHIQCTDSTKVLTEIKTQNSGIQNSTVLAQTELKGRVHLQPPEEDAETNKWCPISRLSTIKTNSKQCNSAVRYETVPRKYSIIPWAMGMGNAFKGKFQKAQETNS